MPKSKTRSETVPGAMRAVYAPIAELIDQVCLQNLNEEYAKLSRELAAALARKRPSPLVRGKPEIWACAIVYALGTVNFLFDKSKTPHTTATELCAAFGVSLRTGESKSREIRKLFRMGQFDPDWCLPSMVGTNPYVWMIEVDGFIMDARYQPREIQEIAYYKGFIPYIPADRPKK